MPVLETSLSADYQPQWGLRNAIREIVSNAIDGEARGAQGYEPTGQMTVQYFPRTERLLVANAGTKVPTSALLMGRSDSRSYESCIGTFGEGLPMALLVLSRLAYKVTIINDDEKWEPSLKWSDQYGEKILTVKTRKLRQPRGLFSVEVGGIKASEWEKFQRMFLRLHPEFNPEEAGEEPIDGARVLFQPEFRGHVFNKGVLVTTRDDLALGYDFNTSLNRDRDFLDGYNIQQCAGRLLKRLFENGSEEQQDRYFEYLVEHKKSFEVSTSYGPLGTCPQFKEAAKRWWSHTKEDNKLPVAPGADNAKLTQWGFETVTVPEAIAEALREGSDDQEDVIESRKREVTKVHEWLSLSDDEKLNLTRGMKAAVHFRPTRMEGRLEVVTFVGENVRGNYVYRDGKYVCQISLSSLTSDYNVVYAIAEAVSAAHHEKTAVGRSRSNYIHNMIPALLKSMLGNLD